jgi:hypothetical protein
MELVLHSQIRRCTYDAESTESSVVSQQHMPNSNVISQG